MKLHHGIHKLFLHTMVNLALGYFLTPVFALPEGGDIVAGQGAISQPTQQDLVVNQNTRNLIINWQGFSIGGSESVQFRQPGIDSVALNRVIGIDPSLIQGRLSANGQIFITNPSGVFFGPGSEVDVHGLLATTLGISDQDFLERNYVFRQDPGKSLASIINAGTIHAAYAGLLAPSVVNRGTIVANMGSIALASGRAATLDFFGDNLINFTITEEVTGTARDAEGNVLDHNVSNEGLLRAKGGQVALSVQRAGDIIKSVVNQAGVIEANTVINKKGRIFLSGGDRGVVRVTGTLDATGKRTGEKGGEIHVTGEKVGLFETAKLDASGAAGGGEILIGGDRLGQGKLANARAAFVGESVAVKANAAANGDGGKIVVYAEDTARIYGSLSARGGSQSGNGGFIETSGKKFFDISKAPDVGAANGLGGEWLIDPFTITIFGFAADIATRNITRSNPFQATAEDAFLNVDLIRQALFQGDVSITTAGAGAQAGDIIWNAYLNYDGTGSNTLSLFANRDINFDAGTIQDPTGGDQLGTVVREFHAGIFDGTPGGDQLHLDFSAGNAINLNADISNQGRVLFTAPNISMNRANLFTTNNPIVLATNNLNSPNDFAFSSLNSGTASTTHLPFSGGLDLGTGPGILSLLGGASPIDGPTFLTASELIFGDSQTGPVTVDGVEIDFIPVTLHSGGTVAFQGGASTFGSLDILAGGDININAVLNTLGLGNSGPTRVLLIGDQGGFGGAGTVLTSDGQIVTIVNGEFANGYANLQDIEFLSQFDLVVWGARGGGFGNVTPTNVIATLESYIQSGGNLLVTGYDTLAHPDDAGLTTLVRSVVLPFDSSQDQVSFSPDWQTTNVDNFILNGAFGDFRSQAFSATGYDDDDLLADTSRGALTLATFEGPGRGVGDRLIYTPLSSGGSVGYWNGGTPGGTTNAQSDFSDGGIPQNIFRNWSDGVGGRDSLFASAGGAINILSDVNTLGEASFTAPVFNLNGADIFSNNHRIRINADNFAMASSIISGTASTSLNPFTAGTDFGLGASPGTFSLTDAEIDSILASEINIGNGLTGPIAVDGLSSATPIVLTTASTVTFNGTPSTLPNLTTNAPGGVIDNTQAPGPGPGVDPGVNPGVESGTNAAQGNFADLFANNTAGQGC